MISPGSDYDHKKIISTTPLDITNDLIKMDCEVLYNFLKSILKKDSDSDEATNQRIGIATSVLMNLTNSELNIYADKLGIMLIASGKSLCFHNLRQWSK
jgi:mRNA deadenylase 3'-5' endonuclease subunit Ccr4